MRESLKKNFQYEKEKFHIIILPYLPENFQTQHAEPTGRMIPLISARFTNNN